MLHNSSIKEKHLGKRGLHLNAQGNAILACNFLNVIRNQESRSFDSNLVFNDISFTDDNLFLDNNVNIVNCNHMTFHQQSESITNNMTSPNLETDLSNMKDLWRQILATP